MFAVVNRKVLWAACISCLLAAGMANAAEPKKPRKLKGPPQPAPADVPYQDIDVILGQTSDEAVTVSILRYDRDAAVTVSVGERLDNLNIRQTVENVRKAVPYEHTISGLKANTRYYYQLHDNESKSLLTQGSFVTQRHKGENFTFTITADSHLDHNADVPMYLQTLSNVISDNPDFHIDLGDTFMTRKHSSRDNAMKQYLAQRYFFSQLQTPLYLVLGNHDGESAKERRGGADSLGNWASKVRTDYFPNPIPNQFYTGNKQAEPHLAYLEDYYAWEWGDALFVVLNPYWQAQHNKRAGRFALSIGGEQYHWLKQTLATSDAKYKLLFVHQLIGGVDRQGRGGVAAVPYGEWGGRNADGSEGFAQYRPDWDKPIHQLLVEHKVDAVFHGHDHLYAKEELDGIVYQTVPQPAHRGMSIPQDSAEAGYTTGKLVGGSGHLRVKVSASSIEVDFVRSDADKQTQNHNQQVLDHYVIQ